MCLVYAGLLIVCYFLSAIESNDDECTKEGEVYEYQEEEDQGQANQGKPSTCCIPESYYFTLHCFTTIFLLCIVFYYCLANEPFLRSLT
jgi:hypothetical protein